MKAFFLILLATYGLSIPAQAAVGYVCGNSDRRQMFMYSHQNLAKLKAYTLSQCRALSDRPELCTAPTCKSYVPDAPVRAPKVARRAPARRPAPRGRAREDYCDATCGAIRAVEEAKRRQREDEIDRVLRDYRDGKLHR